ncbi:MAG: autotransporter domain-containing protein, partial [Proteobacteria bacterium]|nr:autotransporter domain-containing protein [Pseudomonadota bacterium]
PPAPTTSGVAKVANYQTATGFDLSASISGVTNTAVSVLSGPSHGTVTSVVGNVVNYTPANGYYGSDSFTYNIAGPGGTSNTSTVSITVGLPPAPVAGAAAVGVGYNSVSNAIDLTSSITWPSTSVAVAVAPTHGTINSVVGNVVTYTPINGYYGVDTFSYTATGPGGGPSAAAVVTITVANPPPPVASNTSVNVPYNTAKVIDLTAKVTGVSSSIAIASPPGHGTALVAGYTVNFTPTAGYTGPDSFTYTVTGPGGTSAPATVSVTVDTLAPTGAAVTMTVPLNTATTLDLAPHITGSSISGVSIGTNPAHGTVAVNGTRVIFTPANNYFGADSFTYIAYGNGGISPPALITVNVVGRPDPSRDPNVVALVTSQVETVRRTSRAQIANFQGRLESLHRRPSDNNAGTESNSLIPRVGTIGTLAASSNLNSQSSAQAVDRPTGVAYQPGANLQGDPAAGLNQAASVPPAAALANVTAAMSGGSNVGAAAGLGKALTAIAGAAQNGTLNISASTNASGGTGGAADAINVWSGGSVRVGSRNPERSDGYSFSTDGVSVGADKRISDKLVVGVGVGYGRDNTSIGTDGSNTRSGSKTVAVYGSYQPSANTYLDGVLGYGQIDFDNERYVVPVNDFARSRRTADFLFGSLTAGYEFNATGLRLSPYGRLDVAQHRLQSATESGAGLYALRYDSQNVPSMQLSAGLRAESAHEARFGWVLPRLRIEYQHEFKGEQQATVSYADQVGGPRYGLTTNPYSSNVLVLGIGSDILFARGLTLSFDYQMQRSSGQENVQAFFLRLSKNLDGKSVAPPGASFALGSLGLKIDAGYTFDDNVTRASADADRLSDRSFGINVAKSRLIPLGEKTRMFLNGFVGGQRFKNYSGLNNLNGGIDAELQYRASGEFDEPIWSLFGNLTLSDFEANQRDGYRYALGLSMRQDLTDRIGLFGALSYNQRHARSQVFTGSDYSARLNLDYALAKAHTLYLSGECRYGDMVSTGTHTLANINIAKVFTPDEAFVGRGLYAYRVDGRTMIFTLGYNYALGAKDSLDLSWRRVTATPNASPGIPGIDKPRYVVNQFTLMYLTSF